MYSGPHHKSRGNRLASNKLTIIRKLSDQPSTGPIGVADQSNARMRSPISPPSTRNGLDALLSPAVLAIPSSRQTMAEYSNSQLGNRFQASRIYHWPR